MVKTETFTRKEAMEHEKEHATVLNGFSQDILVILLAVTPVLVHRMMLSTAGNLLTIGNWVSTTYYGILIPIALQIGTWSSFEIQASYKENPLISESFIISFIIVMCEFVTDRIADTYYTIAIAITAAAIIGADFFVLLLKKRSQLTGGKSGQRRMD